MIRDGGLTVRTVPFAPPDITEAEIDEVVATLRSGWITTGPRVKQFETDFAAAVETPAALALSSCTAALHVALKAFGIGPGDQVVTSTMTFCSTVHVIEHCGAEPLLVDVERDTLNLDVAAVADVVERHPRVRAIIPVHYGGHPCRLQPLLDLAEAKDLVVVEDAAHAVAAKYRGVPIGSIPADSRNRAVAFSFYATKNLSTAEGGMLTAAPEVVTDASVWSLHGMSHDAWRRYGVGGTWFYEVVAPGFKYNMTDIQAALGIQQLRRLPGMQARRSQVAAAYTAGFAGVAEIETPGVSDDVEHAWHLYPIRLRLDDLSIDRAAFIEQLTQRGVGTSVHFIPVHLHPYYRDRYGFGPNDFPVAYAEYQRIVSLPLHSRLSDEDVAYVIEMVSDVVSQNRR